jgi:hypothetical protein
MLITMGRFKRVGTVWLAILGQTAIATPANAQTLADEVQCVLVSHALATRSDNPQGRQIGASVGAYFMGRLDTRPPAQVKAAIAAQKKRIAPSVAAAAMKACALSAGRAEVRLRALAK